MKRLLQPATTGAPWLSSLLSPVGGSVSTPKPSPVAALGPLFAPQTLPAAAPEPAAARGSARRKLWDLSQTAACPVTGVCLRYADLYQLARKAGLPVQGCTEYEVHLRVVSECRRRSDTAERMQRRLDERYALEVKRSLQQLKTAEDLARAWDEACAGSDWAGMFWAVLTHPRCTPELEFVVLGQVHMLQHQVGMAARVDHSRLHEVMDENLRLGEGLAMAQHRLQSARDAHARQAAEWQAEAVRLRGELIRAQSERDQAQSQWQRLTAAAPDLPTRQALTRENTELLEDNRRLRRALALAEQALTRPSQTVAGEGSGLGDGGRVAAAPPEGDGSTSPSAPALSLSDRAVLCVGGRPAAVPAYRALVENRGGRFLHHDGGEEARAALLGSHLQAADVVICQVGCISHNAYWRVKEHCKRTGKPCLFVESSSRTALERALGQALPGPDPVDIDQNKQESAD